LRWPALIETTVMHPAVFRFLSVSAIMTVALLQGCASLPSLDDRPTSIRLHDTADSGLGRLITPLGHAHPGLSGVVPLLSGRDAFAARVRLADAAERSLDVQYYIWQPDLSGKLLLDALRRAVPSAPMAVRGLQGSVAIGRGRRGRRRARTGRC